MILLSLYLSQAIASTTIGPTAFPVFLKEGFSCILEFEESPTQVVLGDQNLFQIERLNRSIVIKPLTAYATTNLFVYFKSKETKLFLLMASEESEPTYYKKFDSVIPPVIKKEKPLAPITKFNRGIRLESADLDKKKDYLTIDFVITADSSGKIAPNWEQIRLRTKDKVIAPLKLWSERREIQRDSQIRARLIFLKPNIPTDLKDTSIIVPLKGSISSLTLNLERKKR